MRPDKLSNQSHYWLGIIMQKVIAVVSILLLACVATVAGASEATVKAALQKKYPDIPVEVVTKTPVAGIYEVFMNGEVVYTDENATYLFVNASLIDTARKSNLTEERKAQLLRVLKRMLTDRLAADPKGKGGGHESP